MEKKEKEMGIWFEIVSDPNGIGFLVAHINLIWFVVLLILCFLWRMIVGGRRGGGGYH